MFQYLYFPYSLYLVWVRRAAFHLRSGEKKCTERTRMVYSTFSTFMCTHGRIDIGTQLRSKCSTYIMFLECHSYLPALSINWWIPIRHALSSLSVVFGSNMTDFLLSSIINIVFYILSSQGLMISSTLGIWTYTIADHHFHCILSGLVNFVTPVVFRSKMTAIGNEWVTLDCVHPSDSTRPQIHHHRCTHTQFLCLFFVYSLQLFM